jgi:hypothetical protein
MARNSFYTHMPSHKNAHFWGAPPTIVLQLLTHLTQLFCTIASLKDHNKPVGPEAEATPNSLSNSNRPIPRLIDLQLLCVVAKCSLVVVLSVNVTANNKVILICNRISFSLCVLHQLYKKHYHNHDVVVC